MAKKNIGLYLGADSVTAVAIDKKKVVSLAQLDFTNLQGSDDPESLNENIRWEALINKTLREIGVDSKDISVSVVDKEFIFRSFDLPLMSKRQIKSSLAYEVEKYIPFKIEELRWHFDSTRLHGKKAVSLSFLGIKEDSFVRINDFFTHLGLIPLFFEPSSISLVRVLKGKHKTRNLKNFALLDYTYKEAHFTFFYGDLPIFHQTIAVPKYDGAIDVDKFAEAIRFSFQYFEREFKDSIINSLVVISQDNDERLLSLLRDEVVGDIQFYLPSDFVDYDNLSVQGLKAYSIAIKQQSVYKYTPVFKLTKDHIQSAQELNAVALNKAGIIFSLVGGIVVSIFAFIFLGNQTSSLEKSVYQEQRSITIPRDFKNLTSQEIRKVIQRKEQEIKVLDQTKNSLEKQQLGKFLKIIEEQLPEGVWLAKLELNETDGKFLCYINGYVFLGDEYEERAKIDVFISGLRDNLINLGFKNVELISSQRQKMKSFNLTSFMIKLR